MQTASFTPRGIYKSTLGKGTYLSCRDHPFDRTYFVKLPSPPLRARRRSIRCSLEENSKAATIYSLGKDAAALALSCFLGSLLGREEIAQLISGQVSNMTANGTAPHFCVGAAALLFAMGVLIGDKWAAKSGSHCPNGTGSALSSQKSTFAVSEMTNFIKLPSHPLRARPRSIRCSLEENFPNSKAATIYSLGKDAAALALSSFLGSLLGREKIGQLLYSQVSNLTATAKGAAPVHCCVGAAALIVVMGVLIGHKWAAKSGSHCPNAGTYNGSNDSEHLNLPTRRASVKRNALRKVKRSVKVVKDGASRSKLIQMLLKVVLEILKLP